MISDELLEWPPDMLALTEVILQRSEAYRFALSPPAGSTWPPAGFPDWPDAVTDAARRWGAWAEDRNGTIPGLLAREWAVARARAGIPLDDLTEARDWRLCEALLTLHAIADEACAGLGVALDAAGADPDVMVFHAGTTLAGDKVVTNGGRILGVTALGHDIADAIARVYRTVEKIHWEGVHYRSDIGQKAVGRTA